MKIAKPIFTIAIIAFFSLVYVHQQVELVKLSYAIDAKEKKMKDMLDYKDSVGYTIKNLESPLRLETILFAKNVDVAFPRTSQIVKARGASVKAAGEERLKAAGVERRFDFFGILDFFNPRAEAQANEK